MVPEMLTIRQCASKGILKEHQLRVLVKENKIPYIKVGTKVLVNFTALCDQLTRPDNISLQVNNQNSH